MTNIYDILGTDGLTRLVERFYKQVPDDDILGPMYPANEMAEAQQRLADFLIYRFGGPQHYIEQRGHPRLRMRHGPFKVDQKARDRWMELMENAMAEVELPDEHLQALHKFFADTATFMINQPG